MFVVSNIHKGFVRKYNNSICSTFRQASNLRMDQMNAIQVSQFGDPSVLSYTSCPKPIAGPGQVLVQVKAAGVNPVDTYIR